MSSSNRSAGSGAGNVRWQARGHVVGDTLVGDLSGNAAACMTHRDGPEPPDVGWGTRGLDYREKRR